MKLIKTFKKRRVHSLISRSPRYTVGPFGIKIDGLPTKKRTNNSPFLTKFMGSQEPTKPMQSNQATVVAFS